MTKKNNVVSTPTYKYVSTSSKFYFFLEEIEDAKWIAYDTEFISEFTNKLDNKSMAEILPLITTNGSEMTADSMPI